MLPKRFLNVKSVLFIFSLLFLLWFVHRAHEIYLMRQKYFRLISYAADVKEVEETIAHLNTVLNRTNNSMDELREKIQQTYSNSHRKYIKHRHHKS